MCKLVYIEKSKWMYIYETDLYLYEHVYFSNHKHNVFYGGYQSYN